MLNLKLKFFILFITIGTATLVKGQEYSSAYLESKSYDYLSLLFSMKIKDTLTAKQIARATIIKGKLEGNYTKIGLGYEQLARVSEKEEALKMLDSTIHYSINSDHIDFPAIGYLYKSYFQFYDEKYVASLQNAILGYRSAKSKNNVEQQIAALNTISAVNKLWGNYSKSLETDFLTLELIKKFDTLQDNKNYLTTLKNIGLGYVQLKEPDPALHYYNLGIENALAAKDTVAYYEFVSKSAAPLFQKNRIRSAKDSLIKGDIYRDSYNASYVRYFDLNMGKYYFEIGDQNLGVDFLKKIDKEYEINKIVHPELPDVYETLIAHYRKKGDSKKQIEYLYKLNEVTTLINAKKQKVKAETNEGFIIPELVESKEFEIDSLKNKNAAARNIIWWVAGALAIGLFLLFYVYSRQTVYKKRFDELMTNQKAEKRKPKEVSKTNNISPEIIVSILKQLEEFQNKKLFRDKNATLNKVAKSFGTNSSYLSKVVNLEIDKNFSQYLNDLRVAFAIEELNENPRFRKYTIKAIAEESGFKSGESFSKAFYKKHKIYPSYYLKKLEMDGE